MKVISVELIVIVAILPTIVSSHAPTLTLSVIYSEEDVLEEHRFYSKNPDLVLIDTEL